MCRIPEHGLTFCWKTLTAAYGVIQKSTCQVIGLELSMLLHVTHSMFRAASTPLNTTKQQTVTGRCQQVPWILLHTCLPFTEQYHDGVLLDVSHEMRSVSVCH